MSRILVLVDAASGAPSPAAKQLLAVAARLGEPEAVVVTNGDADAPAAETLATQLGEGLAERRQHGRLVGDVDELAHPPGVASGCGVTRGRHGCPPAPGPGRPTRRR